MGSRQRRRQGVRKRRYRARRTLRLQRARRLRALAVACLAPPVLTAALVLPWRWIDPPSSAFMLRERAADGAEIRNDWVPLHEIADPLILCVLAAEDQKFPTHRGFDFASIADALEEDGAQGRGASTISQQVAKNL
ncbi:MAG: monofunctional biosynthetic peptidoglycan transglycosylase, partial [Myxococcales bacterium]|nr:monofunctional biosynthetic peptidoglycan transglycosylase [Myxococcales bacterium]